MEEGEANGGRRMKSLVLLAALLMVVVTVPMGASMEGVVGIVIRMFYLVVFCVGGYLLSSERRWVVLFLSFGVPSLLLGILNVAMPGVGALLVSRDAFTFMLQLLLIWAVIRFSLFCQNASSTDRLIAGVCGYLIIGLMWENLYVMVEHLRPGSFLFSDGSEVTRDGGSFLYLSLVTLSTLGYGDVLPQWALPRVLAALEAVMGTLYLAVFVASLVPGWSGSGKKGDAP